MSDLIDRNFMLSQIEKARAENKTFDYDSLIDFVKVLPGMDQTSKLKKIKAEMIAYRDNDKNDFDFEIGAINGVIAILDKYIHNEENKE